MVWLRISVKYPYRYTYHNPFLDWHTFEKYRSQLVQDIFENNYCIAVEERRRQVASLLSQSKTETQIAAELGVTQVIISRDIKVLKELSNQFVYDLAKSSLAHYYQQCLEGIDQVNRKAWEMYNNDSDDISAKYKLLALKIIIDANQAKFSLFEKGPNIMNIRALEERVNKIEARNINTNQQSLSGLTF